MGRAIVREPQAFLFDEPLSNLDAKLRVQMRLEIRRLHNRLKATSIFVTHDQVEAMTLADQVVVMNKGTIEQVGAPTEVYRRPATKFVATFIGSPAMNLIKGRVAAPGRVEIANGGALEYEAKAFEAVAGREVEVGVRPEDVVLAHGANGAGVALQSEFAEELGPNRLLHGSVGGAPFVVSVPSSDEAPPLGNLHLSAPADKIHLFDLERGQSLRCAS
jgi:sn-glycerol 3-phosphate transport system ATP-binding protein